MIDFIKEVETEYDVSSITLNGIQVWPFLRTSYDFQYNRCYKFDVLNNNSSKAKSILSKLKRVRNIFYGFWNLFKKYDYMVFSDTFERRLINDKYIDKIAEFLISELGEKKVFLIENPVNGLHFNRSKISTKNIISLDLFHVFCCQPFFRKKLVINNEVILKEINKKYGLNINYHMLISRFLCYKNLFKLFYKIYKPKAVFINCYYSIIHQAAIYSAKKMGIRTIELQHGIINNQHSAYNVFTHLDKSFFPDYLLTFGDYVKNIFNEGNYFIKRENVLSVGSMYIDYINNEYKPSNKTIQIFTNFRKKYKKIVTISSQWTVEDKLTDFLKKSASLNKDVLYIFVPRDINKNYSNINFPENIIILKSLDVYRITKETNFHATVNSTCALEAPALGTPDILINFDNLAKRYYLDLLINRDIARFVDTEEEFVNTILTWHTKTKKEIISLHNDFYKENHKKYLRRALNIIRSEKHENNTRNMGI